jgi:oxygen-independent coproporphyrinogen-3 oxidase
VTNPDRQSGNHQLPCSGRLFYSLYIHIPFCARRCSYCDFNTYAGLEALIPAYDTALCGEIRLLGTAAEELPAAEARMAARLPVHTVFLGGGTPSLLPLTELERIFCAVREAFDLLPGAEISLEANPGTLDFASLRGLRELGVNRLSLGMQSAHADELELLGRIHTYEQVVQAVDWARAAGFENLNLDAIFGLPEQTLERWEATLRRSLELGVEHLSLYALTLEEGTPLLGRVEAGEFPQPDADLAADMYDLATELLESAGYQQYEISNWAKNSGSAQFKVENLSDVGNPPYACRHNLQYWRNQPYIGVGAGAHGYIRGLSSELLEGSGQDKEQVGAHGYLHSMRIANVLTPGEYIQRMAGWEAKRTPFPQTPTAALALPAPVWVSPAVAQVTPLSVQDEIGETMMMGLRLTREGVSRAAFQARFGRELADVFGTQIERLIRLGLLEWAGAEGDSLRLTRRGRFIGNQVFVEFI